MSSEVRLSNGGVLLDVRCVASTGALADALMNFLGPWFAPVSDEGIADLTINLRSGDEFSALMRARCTEPFILRRSTAAIFNLEVKRGTSANGLKLAWDEQRQVGYAIDTATACVDLYGSLETAFIHLIELVRYYGLLVEQARGAVVLHSAAVRLRGSDEIVAIVGAKGAGKTTTMLSLVASGEYDYFSGDKLLLDSVNGGLRARGWPDYPHIGIGTLRNHPDLARRLEVGMESDDGQPLPDQHKVLLEPARFLAAIGRPTAAVGRLSRIVLPRIHEGDQIQYKALEFTEKQTIPVSDMFEWPHQFLTSTWHGLPCATNSYAAQVPPDLLRTLESLPWEYRLGKGTTSVGK